VTAAERTAADHVPAPRLRADARRNRERVLTAAAEVFAERGLDSTVSEVAARAGVGKATVYRSFPARSDLLAAVALHRLSWYEDRLRTALEQDDVAAAVRDYVRDVFLQLRTDRGLGDALRSMPASAEVAARLRALGARLVERGVAAGALRAGLVEDDLRLLVDGLNRALVERGETRAAPWRRAADLVLSAVSA
jgi:AcrR family transcriptional regulator